MYPTLYPRQKEILNYIEKYISENGHSPTLMEIKTHIGVKTLSTVHEHITRLKDKGFLEKIKDSKTGLYFVLKTGAVAGSIISIPLVGRIAAGKPILAVEEADKFVPLPEELVGNKKVYCLKVEGDSMIESLIADQDIVVVEKVDYANDGDTIVALLDDGTATLKKIYKEKKYIRLQPANPNYKPLKVKSVTIQGRVIAIYRNLQH